MIKAEVIAHSLYESGLLDQIKDLYEEGELEIYMGYVVNTQTGEVMPVRVRLHNGEWELFKVVAV